MEGEDETAAVSEVEADARVGGEAGDRFADDAFGLRRGRILGVLIARHVAGIGKRTVVGGEQLPHVLEADGEGGSGNCQAADRRRVSI